MTTEPSPSIDPRRVSKDIEDAVSQGRCQEEKRRQGKVKVGSEEDCEDKESLQKDGEEDGEEGGKEGEDKETLRSQTEDRSKEKSGKGRKEKIASLTLLTVE